MKEITRAEGMVRIRVPDSASDVSDVSDVQTAGSSAHGSRRGSRSGTASAVASSIELGIMLDALEDEDSITGKPLAVVDRFAVDVGEGSDSVATRGRRAASTDKQELNIDLDLQPGESAVVLIEQDGSYEWHYPTRRDEPGAQRSGNQRGRARGSSLSKVSFRIPIGSSGRLPRPSGTARTHRGPVTNFIKGKIQGFVLKFIARKTVGALTRRLERGVTEGPVLVNSASNATHWVQQSAYPTDSLPADRDRRILLLVHGTFSSTLGSFGALTAYDEGQALLQEALGQYDLVVGYDHYTLSETPEQNAEALLSALMPLVSDGHSLELDAIAFSRGGLVYRYLSEVLIPDSSVSIICRKAIFVGCTNNGTELANDENWKHLMDFYTNMIAGATRLIGLAPGAALPTQILRQGIKVIGSMVSYMAQDGVANNSVPGVAAMEPAGAFVTAMNAKPAHRSTPGARAYYALGSNFEPSDSNDALRLGKRLVLQVADGFVDKLMGRANDLVVNNDSMFVIDPVPGARLIERRSVNANGRIYHTVYFHQPMVADTCGQWLGILEPAVASRGNVTRTGNTTSLPRNWWADAVNEDFILLPYTSSVSGAVKRLKNSTSPMVVLQRIHNGGMLYYGFSCTALSTALKGTNDPHVSVGDFLGLHEWQSRTLSIDKALMTGSPSALRSAATELGPEQGFPGADLTVITDNDNPVGVLMPASADRFELMPRAVPRTTATPASRGVSRESGRRMSGGASRGAEAAPEAATVVDDTALLQRVWCNMHAMMPEEVPVESIATLEVTLSRDLIAREGGISDGGEFEPDRPLIIQALARKHCDIINSDRIEVPLPAPGSEVPVYFDIKALHTGVGEVDVFARQGNQAIINLKLRPTFIKKKAIPVDRATVVIGELQPLAPRQELPDVLYIHDIQVGAERYLEFNFQSRQARLQGRFRSKTFKSENSRLDYIANLYEEIEKFWANGQEDYDSFMEHLMARGANLFETLLPVEIQEKLWAARDKIQGIQVFSDEPFIPWELLYLKQPGKPARPDSCFLVEKGMLRWVSNMQFAPTEIRLRDGHFRHVVPNYPAASGYSLPGAQAERKMLEAEFGAKAVTPDSKAVKKALSSPLEHDILHFACHGQANSSSIWNSGLLMRGKMAGSEYVQDELSYEWTSMFASMKDEYDNPCGPLVFLNACQTGRQGYNLTGTGGFAQALVKAGASAFVGSHWSIGDATALEFSRIFYRELLQNDCNMMDAVTKARQAAKNNQEVTWLAYAVYADPYARVVHG